MPSSPTKKGPEPAASGTPVTPLRVIGSMMRPYRKVTALGIVLGALATGAGLAQPYFIGELVGHIQREEALTERIVLLVGLFAAEALLLGAQGYVLGRAGTGIVLDVRRTLVSRLLRVPMSHLSDFRRGDLMTRVVTDTSMLRTSLTQAIATLGLGVLTVIGATVLMVSKDVVLTLTMLACILVTAVASVLIAMRIRTATVEMQERLGGFGTALQRALGAVSTIKISRAEQRESVRVDRHAEATYSSGVRQARLNALLAPVANGGVQATFALVFAVGAVRMRDGSLSLGDYSAFLLYLFYVISPLVNVFTSFAQFQQGMASALRVHGVLHSPVETETSAAAPDVTRSQATSGAGGDAGYVAGGDRAPDGRADSAGHPDTVGSLHFQDVGFGYLPDSPVLDSLTVTLPAKGLTAVVGPSGCGKSTMLMLALRLWQHERGSILLKGRDIRELPLDELRRRMTLVEQDAHIVDGTIKENILLAAPDADERRLDAAVHAAALAPWIETLEHGLDTPAGEDGASLSGGQRQRIAIARALLADPEVLLLDEATSQLDGETEQVLRDSVKELSRERAVLVTAHRLSTVQDADLIVVLEGGRVRALGTHEELAEVDELYQRLISTQLLSMPAAKAVTDKATVR